MPYFRNGLTDIHEIWQADAYVGLLAALAVKNFEFQKSMSKTHTLMILGYQLSWLHNANFSMQTNVQECTEINTQ